MARTRDLVWIWLINIIYCLTGHHLIDGVNIPSYCQWETFNATCPKGHVILMTFAEYGRMRVGRCLSTDYYTGCQANVLDHMDERCSGRQTCTISIPDPKLFNVQPCRKDLVAYLEADYNCVPVANLLLDKSKSTPCRGPIDLTHRPSGYILSSVTATTGLGSRTCPWLIKVKRGQRINITVYDFSSRSASYDAGAKQSSLRAAGPGRVLCPVYASLKEAGTLYDKPEYTATVGICATEKRRRWLYTTRGSTLMVRMINITKASSTYVHFMLKYEVVGCADLKTPIGAYMERKGDSLIISCNTTQETWHLVCKGNTWIGDYRNCTSAHNKMAVGESGSDEHGFPLGLLVAIAIGVVVGVVLGFVFLIGIFICRRRSRRDTKQDSGNPLMSGAGLDPEQQNIYRLVEVRPPPPLMCECHLAADPKTVQTLDSKVSFQSLPDQRLYGTSPHPDRGGVTSPEVDNRQNQLAQQLKPCDIISDIHRVGDDIGRCANGQDCYSLSPDLRTPGEAYPAMKPLPVYRRDRRLGGTRLATTTGSGSALADLGDSPIYETRQ